MSDPTFVVRAMVTDDEASAIRAHRALAAEAFPFMFDFTPGDDFVAYVRRVDALNAGPGTWSEGGVPGCFLVGVVGDELVGRLSVRYELNDFLAEFGGHIGYCTVPDHRQRGYSTRLLEKGLEILRARDTAPILLTVDEPNAASRGLIERAGGRLVRIRPGQDEQDPPKCHYHF